MPNAETERLLNEIGQLLTEDMVDQSHKALLHAELAADYVAPSIYEDLGDRIIYRDGDLRLSYALLDLWEAQEPDRRWAEIEYLLLGRKFDAAFKYPEEIDTGENSLDRRDHIVEKYFGKKPIVYPPPPSDAMEFKPS